MKMVQSIPKKRQRGINGFKRSFVYSSEWWDEKMVGWDIRLPYGNIVPLGKNCSNYINSSWPNNPNMAQVHL